MEVLSLVEEKVGDSLEYTDTGKVFLKRPLIAQALRSTINKREPHETEKLLHAKEHHHSDKAAAADRKDIYQLHIL